MCCLTHIPHQQRPGAKGDIRRQASLAHGTAALIILINYSIASSASLRTTWQGEFLIRQHNLWGATHYISVCSCCFQFSFFVLYKSVTAPTHTLSPRGNTIGQPWPPPRQSPSITSPSSSPARCRQGAGVQLSTLVVLPSTQSGGTFSTLVLRHSVVLVLGYSYSVVLSSTVEALRAGVGGGGMHAYIGV